MAWNFMPAAAAQLLVSVVTLVSVAAAAETISNCSAVAIFSFAGQEFRKTFDVANRTFGFQPRIERDVVIHQAYKEGGAGLGSAAWDGSVVLADFLAQLRPDCPDAAALIRGHRVLEIGAGVGLVSTVAGLLNASTVVATDGDAALLPLIRQNFASNVPNATLNRSSATLLRWGRVETQDAVRTAGWEPFDVLLLADVVYEADGKKAAKAAGVVASSPAVTAEATAAAAAAAATAGGAAARGMNASNATLLQIHGPGHAFRALLETLLVLTDAEADVDIFLSYKRRYGRERAFFRAAASHFKKKRVPRRCLHPDFRTSGIDIFHLKRRRRKRQNANASASDGGRFRVGQ